MYLDYFVSDLPGRSPKETQPTIARGRTRTSTGITPPPGLSVGRLPVPQREPTPRDVETNIDARWRSRGSGELPTRTHLGRPRHPRQTPRARWAANCESRKEHS